MDKPLLKNALERAIMEKPERRLDGKLWASDLGKNPHGAIRRLLTGYMEPFDYATRLKMEGGVALEDHLIPLAVSQLQAPARLQFPLYDEIWSGYADLVLNHGVDARTIIYDHKGSAGQWWDYKESLPRVSDMAQVWLYGQLYRARYPGHVIPVETRLLYTGWGTWAEFSVRFDMIPAGSPNLAELEPGMVAEGWISHKPRGKKDHVTTAVTRYRRVNPWALREELESKWSAVQAGLIPEEELAYLDPGGPDWDYAEDNYDRLAREYPDAGLVLPGRVPVDGEEDPGHALP